MSARSHLTQKLFRTLIAVVVTTTSLPLTSSGVVVRAEAPVEEAPSARTPPGMRLFALVDPPVVEPGAQAVCTVTVVNDDVADEEGLTLRASLAQDMSLGKGKGRTWQAEIPALKMGERAEVTLDLRVTGRPTGALTFEIELRDARGKVRATTTAVVGVVRAEKAQRIGAMGGRFAAEDGRVRVDFPAGALPAEASVTARMKTQQVEPRGRARVDGMPPRSGVLLQFSLEAQDTATGEAIHTFAQPVILSVDLRGLIDASGLLAGQHLYLSHIVDPETREGEDVPFAYDPETGILTTQLDHFSEYDIGMVGEGWKPILTPPVPDLFSGAAVYHYPIQVPPGRNGLQPDLALSYNSRQLDRLKKLGEDDGELVALGWSLGGVPEISRYHVIKSCFDHVCVLAKEEFTLAIDGASYDLRPATAGQRCGRYFADGAPGLYVERRNAACGNGAANQTSDYWIARTPDGTLYRFGSTPESELWIHQSNSGLFKCGDPDGSGFCEAIADQADAHYAGIRWLLDYVEGPQGPGKDVMKVQYRPNKTVDTGASLSDVEKTMPVHIYYNLYGPNQYASEVRFIPVANDVDDNGYTRIKQIDVYHLGTRIRQIRLTTDEKDWDGYSERAMMRIQELSGDGSQALPPVEFVHEALPNDPDDYYYRRVSEINLGYGGRIAFAYIDDGRSEQRYSYRVAETETYDGISSTPARVTYDYGQRCYDQKDAGQTGGGSLCRGAHAYERTTGPLVGHSWVAVTAYGFGDVPVNKTIHRYYITDTGENHAPAHWQRGKEWRTQVYEGDGTTLLQQMDTEWAGDNNFSYVAQTISADYTGSAPITTTVAYEYDPALQGGVQYGNLTHVREYGDGTTPYRTTVMTYTLNADPGVWIVGEPETVKVYEGDERGTLLSWTESYYDNSTVLGAPPISGTLTMVRQVNPLTSIEVVEVEYAYDAWGNLTDVWDPLDNHTGIAYDPVYHLYPLTATNALEQHRYVEYYSVNAPGAPSGGGLPGQVWRVWDDNGEATATAYTYDPFGRLATVIRPGDSPALPTVAYWYDETTASTRVVYELYSAVWRDHAYNTVANWQTSKDKDYAYQSAPFRVSATQQAGTVPLHRYVYVGGWHGCQHDTQYTTGGSPGAGWEYQGVLGYIWTSAGPGRVPVYQCEMHEYYTYDHMLVLGDEPCPAEYTDGGRPLLGYVEPATAPIRVGVSQREVSGQAGTLDSTVYYDGLGRQVQARAEAEGDQWTVASTSYDALGRPEKGYLPRFESGVAYSVPGGPYTLTTYDALGRAVRVDNPDGTYATTVYGGLLTTAIDANGHQKRYTNDVWGQLVQVEEYTGTYPSATLYATTGYGYDRLGHLVTVTDTNEVTTTMHYDGLGRKDWMDDPDMGHWEYDYDLLGNLTSQTDARGCTINFDYDALNRLEEKSYSGTCSTTQAVHYFYDEPGYGYSLGRLTHMTDSSGSATWRYDARGRVVTETKTIDAQTFTTQYVYDAADRPVATIYPDSEVVAYTYNSGGALESLSGYAPYVQSIDYNPLGQITAMAYGNGVTMQYTYHPLNLRLENVQASNATDTLLDLSTTYDPVGNVQTITDDVLHVRQQFAYDDLDRLTRGHQEAITTTEQAIGEVGFINDTLTHTPQTVILSRSYVNPVVFATPVSRDGGDTSVVRITDVQADRFTLYVHEGPDRDGAHTTEAVSYVVLEAGSWTLPDGTRLEVGQVNTSATVGAGVVDDVWAHVILGSPFGAAPVVVSQVQTDNDPHWVKTRQRNVTASGFDVALEEEDANTASHGGEIIGWLAIEPGMGTWNGHKYEAAQTADVVSSTWAAISFAQSFASAPRFVGGIATYDGGDGAYLRYDRTSLTASGVQVMIEEDTTADEETDHTDEVVHYLAIEGSGTLTGMAVTGAPGGPGTYDRTYAYDAIGNITSKSDVGTYTYQDPLHVHAVTHIDGVQRYAYDANGNMTQRDRDGDGAYDQALTFTAENKVQTVTEGGEETTFTYDGNGARVKKEDSSGTTYYVGGLYEKMAAGGVVTTTSYYYAAGQRVAMRTTVGVSTTVTYLHGDHLSSTSLTTDAAGALVARVLYYPYGETRYTEGTLTTDYGYTGQRNEAGLGLMDYGARFYDPTLGRFVSADTIVPEPANPQDWNRFAYVSNNPLKYVDPSGHCKIGEYSEYCYNSCVAEGMAEEDCRAWYLRDDPGGGDGETGEGEAESATDVDESPPESPPIGVTTSEVYVDIPPTPILFFELGYQFSGRIKLKPANADPVVFIQYEDVIPIVEAGDWRFEPGNMGIYLTTPSVNSLDLGCDANGCAYSGVAAHESGFSLWPTLKQYDGVKSKNVFQLPDGQQLTIEYKQRLVVGARTAETLVLVVAPVVIYFLGPVGLEGIQKLGEAGATP